MAGSGCYSKVAVLGPGLLGGSVALAVRKYLPGSRVFLWGRRREPLDKALEIDAADVCSTDIGEIVADAELIVMASPVGAMRSLAEAFLPHVRRDVLVTDVGSVKAAVHRDVGGFLSQHAIRFIGSHPMAGSEKQGIDYAGADLFRRATVALTNDECVGAATLQGLKSFWESFGARCLELDSAEHDRMVARVSHLPHAMAALCVHSVCGGIDLDVALRLASTGFRDTTRVAGGGAEMWAEILLENRDSVLDALREASRELEHLERIISGRESGELHRWLEKAQLLRELLVSGRTVN